MPLCFLGRFPRGLWLQMLTLRSGRVFVYTGILPICKDTNGLAAVLAHEIAHVVAHHPAERMSNGLFKFGIVMALSLLFDISGQFSSLLVNLMYSLPNSRVQEVMWPTFWCWDYSSSLPTGRSGQNGTQYGITKPVIEIY